MYDIWIYFPVFGQASISERPLGAEHTTSYGWERPKLAYVMSITPPVQFKTTIAGKSDRQNMLRASEKQTILNKWLLHDHRVPLWHAIFPKVTLILTHIYYMMAKFARYEVSFARRRCDIHVPLLIWIQCHIMLNRVIMILRRISIYEELDKMLLSWWWLILWCDFCIPESAREKWLRWVFHQLVSSKMGHMLFAMWSILCQV